MILVPLERLHEEDGLEPGQGYSLGLRAQISIGIDVKVGFVG